MFGNQGLIVTFSGLPTSAMSPITLSDYHAAGHVVALCMLHLGQVVEINSWLLSALLRGPAAFVQSFKDIELIDPSLAVEVKPWFDFDFLGRDKVFPSALRNLFIEVFDRTVSPH